MSVLITDLILIDSVDIPALAAAIEDCIFSSFN